MSDYTIKVSPDKERVLFSGINWGYGIGSELPLWDYQEHLGLVVVKKGGTSYFGGQGQTAHYAPAGFMVLRIIEPAPELGEGWVRAERIISFPIRRLRR